MTATLTGRASPIGARLDEVVQRRPPAAFVVLAFALSWMFWLGSWLASSELLFFFGGLGPAMAAALVAWRRQTLQSWLSGVLRWRVSPRFYAFAFGFPVLLYGVPNVVLALFGQPAAWSLLPERLPVYLATWGAALLMGGLEEPGWRGYALPQLQQRLSPVRATLLLGVVWGLWHLPVAPAAIVVTVPLAFLYTWLWNRTGSALLCVLLHASITPAQDHLSVVADGPAVDLTILATLIVAAGGFVLGSGGRLGRDAGADGSASHR